MKELHSFLIKVAILLLFRHTVEAQDCAKECSPFNFTCASSMSPSFGSEVGGTVVRIDNGPNGGCPLRFDADILCRFENADKSFSKLVPGILVRLGRNTVECVSPFSGKAMSVKVSYAAIPNDCGIDKATFFEVNEEFQYIGDRAGLILRKTHRSTPVTPPTSSPHVSSNDRPSFESGVITLPPTNPPTLFFEFFERRLDETEENYYPTSSTTSSPPPSTATPSVEPTDLQFFFAGDMIQAEWHSDALSLSSPYPNSAVNVDILAYNAAADADRSSFVKIQSFNQLPAESDRTTFVLDDAIISPFMIDWGSNGNRVAVILVQIVASSTQFWNQDDPDAQWILATRTSKLIGVFPANMEENGGECPILYNQDCESSNNPEPCPSSHDIALEDFSFSPDSSCPWSSGSNSCDPSLDLEVDWCITSCLAPFLNEFSSEEERSSCPDVDDCQLNEDARYETDGCPCASSHPGATGCVTNGLTQCCYTENGALITEYDDGAGRPKCVQSGVTSTELVDTFLFDILPYQLCCGLNKMDYSCESYYNALPDNFREDSYENPSTAAVSFGDPHLITFDTVNYNFNGYGEYVAVCGGPVILNDDDINELCSTSRRKLEEEEDKRTLVHFRFRPYLLENGQNATVHVGIAIQDPCFHNGNKRLIITLDGLDRLRVYQGGDLITFPTSGRKRVMQVLEGVKISVPRETSRTKQKKFVMRISFVSGLRIKISEAENVMNPTITRPRGSNAFIGLLGKSDGNESNEFTLRDGTSVPISLRFDSTEEDYTALDDERIFDDFGKEWEIVSEDVSLFNDIDYVTGQEFNKFLRSEFRPDFDSFFDPDINQDGTRSLRQSNGRQLQTSSAEEICAQYENAFIRQACIFDFGITGNEALVRSTSDFAEEEKAIQRLLLNTPPGVLSGDRSQNITIGISIDNVFKIHSFDMDGDTISATLTRNDVGLFELSDEASVSGIFEVHFLGSNAVGNFKAHVTLTDGTTPVLVTITAIVVRTAPPTHDPSEPPSSSPTFPPTTLPTHHPSEPPSSSPTFPPTALPTHHPSSSPSKSPKSPKKSSKSNKALETKVPKIPKEMKGSGHQR